MEMREPLVRHPGSRQAPTAPHIARAFKAMQRTIDDQASQLDPQELQAVQAAITTGQPCTGAAFADIFRMWTYRRGAAAYADVAVGCGTASVVQVRLTAPDFTLLGAATVSAAGGEQVLRVTLAYPDAWAPGDTHYVTVQGFRASGADATTMQVVRGWQR
jgi:hypothetical protein